MMTTAHVKWVEEMTLVGVDSNGKSVVMSTPNGPGVSPMQMLLLGLGGCTMLNVVDILHKQKQPLTGFEVVIEGERDEEYPKPWITMHMKYILTGTGLDAHKVERAISLSVEKYCGVHATLAGVTNITHEFAVHNVPGEA